jgi:hypothetical protein
MGPAGSRRVEKPPGAEPWLAFGLVRGRNAYPNRRQKPVVRATLSQLLRKIDVALNRRAVANFNRERMTLRPPDNLDFVGSR